MLFKTRRLFMSHSNGVSTPTYTYDNDGNLTSSGTSTFSWDDRNRPSQAVTQGSTSTYAL
jgi:hypothetical protein